jgi:thioredoxin 1
MVQHITDATFEQEVAQHEGVVLLDVYKNDCGPCNLLAPRLDEVATEFAGRVKVVKAEISTVPATAARLGVQSFPMVYLFKNGAVQQAVLGAKLVRHYREMLLALL